MTDTNHPWSSDPAAQAAIRAAEGERGPQIAHRDVPEAVERLFAMVNALEIAVSGKDCAMSERVARLEDRMDAIYALSKCDAAWAAPAFEHPAADAAAVPNPLPEATTGSGSVTGLRTERVTLEVTHRCEESASNWEWHDIAVDACAITGNESVRVVPTPGPGLTEEQEDALEFAVRTLYKSYPRQAGVLRRMFAPGDYARDAAAPKAPPTPGPGLPDDVRAWITETLVECWGHFHDRNREGNDEAAKTVRKTIDKLSGFLARDAAAREGRVDVAGTAEVQAMYEDTVSRLTAERDAAIRERDEMFREREEARAKLATLEPIAKVHAKAIAAADRFNAEQLGRQSVDRSSVYVLMDAVEEGLSAGTREAIRPALETVFAERDAALARVRELENAIADARGLMLGVTGPAYEAWIKLGEAINDPDVKSLPKTFTTEAAGKPVAWGYAHPNGTLAHVSVMEPKEGTPNIVPLYAAPQQERVVRLPPSAIPGWMKVRVIIDALDAAGVRWEVVE